MTVSVLRVSMYISFMGTVGSKFSGPWLVFWRVTAVQQRYRDLSRRCRTRVIYNRSILAATNNYFIRDWHTFDVLFRKTIYSFPIVEVASLQYLTTIACYKHAPVSAIISNLPFLIICLRNKYQLLRRNYFSNHPRNSS